MAFSADPNPASDGAVTLLLERLAEGEEEVLDELFPIVYAELKKIARGQRRRRGSHLTLETTGLIHEAYLRFAKGEQHVYSHRQHFYAVAAQAIQRVLVDHARSRSRRKRGGGWRRVSLDDAYSLGAERRLDLLDLQEAMERMRTLDEVRRGWSSFGSSAGSPPTRRRGTSTSAPAPWTAIGRWASRG